MKQKMIELDVKLKVSPKLIKKIRAYAVLVDQKPDEFVEYFTSDILSKKLDQMIDALIRGELDGEDANFLKPGDAFPSMLRKEGGGPLMGSGNAKSSGEGWQDSMESDLANQGAQLYDDVDEEELYSQALEEEAEILSAVDGGVTDDDIEHDLDVENPEQEAAADAPDVKTGIREDAYITTDPEERQEIREANIQKDVGDFASMMGIDMDGIEPRIVAPKALKQDLGKGAVSEFGASSAERSTF